MAEKSERARREEAILKFWKDNQIFSKTLSQSKGKKEFVFYEGPPTANGRPGIHHLEARSFKDAIPRYKTMRGYQVSRRGGWDTHGLPVELEVEKQLGLKSKKEIEQYGVAKFNEECKKSVWKYIDEWRRFTDRVGHWIDLDNAYVTYENSYIEALWSVLSHVDKRKLLYKDYKVLPWCSRCGTALSSHELAQEYQDVKDISLYVKFKVVGQENTYLVAWTTTPWTLPGNVALAVGKDVEYVQVRVGEEQFILAKERLPVLGEQFEVIGRMKSSELVGLEYKPLYPFLDGKSDKAFKVYEADFVNTTDGTGIVHTAVMYGQDDFELGKRIGLPKYHLVDESGHFKPETDGLAGKSVVEESTAVEILKDLQERNLLFKKESHAHSYPFCWRCKTRIIYYARDSWYIAMSKLRDELVQENEKIHWEPEYIRQGRFGEWLHEVKDWAISRERYWGTPLPVWQSADGKIKVVGSLEELKKYTKKSGNKYFIMRHAEAENNAKRILDLTGDPHNHLTEKGREEVKNANVKDFDLVFSSPFLRARETAAIIKKDFEMDERLREIGPNEEGTEVRRRMGEFLFDIEQKYSDKNILIISHGFPIWTLFKVAAGAPTDWHEKVNPLKTAEVKEVSFIPYSHNEDYELDLHRPYIDKVVLKINGEEYRRVKEVMDVWFDSGAMPFAQDAEYRENSTDFSKVLYPADFISEAIDQTRGWFYTLHAIGILMERGRAYKNVICLGHILDKEGKKMSKSLGNVIDPWEMIDKYGVDTLRLWMYSVNQPGESKNFDERTVDELQKRVFNLLDNVCSFYELYRDRSLESNRQPLSRNILDRWIIERLTYLIEENTQYLNDYKLLEPVRNARDFIDDLSTWYLRRSRERIKSGNAEAKRTLYFVLKKLSIILAPFTPFVSEEIYRKLRLDNDVESVHLEKWPEGRRRFYLFGLSLKHTGRNLLNDMVKVRHLVSLALELRQKASIKVRQPLNELKIKNSDLGEEYLDIIKDELNVKSVVIDLNLSEEIQLNTQLTPELVEEGKLRDAIRAVQEWRKEKGLNPGEKVDYEVPETEKELFIKYTLKIENSTNVKLIEN